MRWKKSLQLLDVHCEGEVGKVVLSGVYDIPGKNIMDKMNYLNKVDDSFRRLVCLEPRGAVNQTVNLMLPSDDPAIDASFIVLQADEAHPMSGANTMCVATALLEMGLVEMHYPETLLRLEAPAGVVIARAECEDGKCTKVSLEMPPAFVESLGLSVVLDDWGKVPLDIAFGGVYYAIVNSDELRVDIAPENISDLVKAGMDIKEAANRSFNVKHPTLPDIDHISYTIFYQKVSKGVYKTCCTLWPGRVDRSPCGTGSSAIISLLHEKGEVETGEEITTCSIIDSKFKVVVSKLSEVKGKKAVIPQVTGRCWVYGMSQVSLDSDDPFADGFALSDSWGPKAINI